MEYKRTVNDNDIDIMIECIIDGYIKNIGIRMYIPIEIMKMLCQYYGDISQSNILTKPNDWYSLKNMISKQLKKDTIYLYKLYDTDMDGFEVETFHNKCDNKGATLCIIKNEYDYIFGGYTSLSWNNPINSEYKHDKHAFLYNYYPIYKIIPLKDKSTEYAVRHQQHYGLAFGCGCDFIIYHDIFDEYPDGYSIPQTYNFDIIEFAKTKQFKILQLEVFHVM